MIGLFHFGFLIADFRLKVPDLLNHSFDLSTFVHGSEEAEAEVALAANREGSRGLGWVQRIAAKGLKHIRQGSSETVVLFETVATLPGIFELRNGLNQAKWPVDWPIPLPH